ncbi:uncharacterized protein LOC116266225 isoform X1 [Nymphaea colorata]|nr:uncharacterized protein LOC116266225 isoform X1 [Nymphaea colorata]
MANAFAPQSLIRCQLSRHAETAGIFQPKQWRASLASPNPKSLFSEENRSKLIGWSLAGALALGLSLAGPDFADAKIGVNKPALLPKEFSPVIDVAGFLSPGQGSMHGDVLDKIYRSQASVIEEKLLEYETKIELSILAKNKSLKLDNHMTKLLKWLWGCWKEDLLAFIEDFNADVQFLRLLTRSSLLLSKQEDAEDTSQILTYLPSLKLMRTCGKGPCSMLIEALRVNLTHKLTNMGFMMTGSCPLRQPTQ